MKAPAVPIDEECRLEALSSLKLLDSDSDERFDRIVNIGKNLFGVEICLVSLVDKDRQWFKARAGLDATETGRDISFCGHAILGDEVFVIKNALEDERFRDNPLVTGPPDIRFYAGAPLMLPSGYKIGTLCIISSEPKPGFGKEDALTLADLGAVTVDIIANDALRDARDSIRRTHDKYVSLVHLSSEPMAVLNDSGQILDCNQAFNSLCGVEDAENQSIETYFELEEGWIDTDNKTQRLTPQDTVKWEPEVAVHAIEDGFIVYQRVD